MEKDLGRPWHSHTQAGAFVCLFCISMRGSSISPCTRSIAFTDERLVWRVIKCTSLTKEFHYDVLEKCIQVASRMQKLYRKLGTAEKRRLGLPCKTEVG